MTAEEAKKALDEKEAELKAAKSEIEKANKRVEEAQGLIHKWEEEVGEDRKARADGASVIVGLGGELTEANKALKKAQEDLAKTSLELAEAKKQGPAPDAGNTQEKKTAEEIEAELTADESKRADEAYKNAPDELKAQIKSDAKVRKQFLLKAKEATAANPDLTSWRNTPAQKKEPTTTVGDELNNLFETKKKSAEHIPSGPRPGVSMPGHADSKPRVGPKAKWMS
ncbi:MAG TPA: hypothetical protein VNA25_17335 [Phycisphaerae bacterium]|nr:hypothetical protein [Phycisphaerae bacterium]